MSLLPDSVVEAYEYESDPICCVLSLLATHSAVCAPVRGLTESRQLGAGMVELVTVSVPVPREGFL